MHAKYAHLISRTINRIHADHEGAIDVETKYLLSVIYPNIALAMWRGLSFALMASSRLSDKLRRTLRDQGYVVEPTSTSDLTTRIAWGLQRIPESAGVPERWVSAPEYNLWLDQIDAMYDEALDGRNRDE